MKWRYHNKVSWVWYETASTSKTVLKQWRMWSISSLSLLPGPLWFRVVVPVRVPSMGQKDLFENYHYQIEIFKAISSSRSLTLTRHPPLSSVAPGRSSRLHPVSAHSWCMEVFAGPSTLVYPCVSIHKRTSLMSSSLLLQQCPGYFVRLTWKFCEMVGKWPCTSRSVGVLLFGVVQNSI